MFKNIFYFIIFLFIFIFLIISLSLGSNKLSFIKEKIPSSFKENLKTNLFYFPNLIAELKNENLLLKDLNNDYKLREEIVTLEFKKINFFSKNILTFNSNTFSSQFELIKWKLPFWNYSFSKSKPVAYIEVYNDDIILMSGNGKIIYFNSNNISTEPSTSDLIPDIKSKIIRSNFDFFIKDDEIFKKGWFSIKDITLINDYLYVSLNKNNENNCYNTKIIKAKFNFNFLIFNDFINLKNNDCVLKSYNGFTAHQVGGRMIEYKNHHMLFSTGDYRKRDKAQDDNSMLGKILLVNLEDGKYKIFSKGHRNPQGLLYLPEEDIILSTEHGPRGGDEINKIEENKNYGWPVSSYGEHYCLTDTITEECESLYKKFPVYKSHKDYDFVEPLKYYVPSIAPSEIVKIPPSFSKNINNSFFVSSLTGNSNLKEIKHG